MVRDEKGLQRRLIKQEEHLEHNWTLDSVWAGLMLRMYIILFLINGKQTIEYPDFKPGEKVRVRVINGGASTSFWMTFGVKTQYLFHQTAMT
jgi:hypothetical protein